MIFGEAPDTEQQTVADLVPATVATMLMACAEEASRMASALNRLDMALSKTLLPHGQVPLAVQEIDLLRQEAEGLASVLRLVAADPNPTRTLCPAEVAGAIAVWAQCERMHATLADLK